jgi:hypothetical protein
VNHNHLARTCTALIAGAALFTGVVTAAGATNTFNVSTTITNSCTVTDKGPTDLTPTYTPVSDSGTGAETSLNTFCNGEGPTVAFTDAAATGSGTFIMYDGASQLDYQISNNAACNGTSGDFPILEGAPQNLTPGNSSYDICAAVIAGVGLNTAVPAGSYTDTVTYTISP